MNRSMIILIPILIPFLLAFSIIILTPFLIAFSWKNPSPLKIENGRLANSIQIKSDYDLIQSVYEKFSERFSEKSSKHFLKPLHIMIDYDHNQGGIGVTMVGKDGYEILTENSRGIWFHELLHYFSDQLPQKPYPNSRLDNPDLATSVREEFLCSVISNVINGTTANDFRSKYAIRK